VDASLLATELADYLVKKGLPFREAHSIVGKIVRKGIEKRVEIRDLRLEELRELSPAFETDVRDAFDAATAVTARTVIGGTAPTSVRDQIAAAKLLRGVGSPHKDDVRWPVHHVEQTTA
jgi:argininosuccinate lyase